MSGFRSKPDVRHLGEGKQPGFLESLESVSGVLAVAHFFKIIEFFQ